MYLFSFCRVADILGAVPSISKLKGNTSDDWIDRISHLYTVLILVVFAVVVSTGTFVGDPIQCWCPAEFTDAYEEYTKSMCWISNTYYVPMGDTIPVDLKTRQDKELTYYQWVPLILMFQALLFKLPNLIWKMFHSAAGISLDRVIDFAQETQCSSPEDRADAIGNLSNYVDKWLWTYQEYKHNKFVKFRATASKYFCLMCNKRGGTFLTGLFICVKFMYLINIIGQFFILNAFMGSDYNFYGFEVISAIANGDDFRESARFPRVTLCDFRIRQLNNLQTWTVQCVLPINLFNEKIFIFIWFWLVFVAFLSSYSVIKWIAFHIMHNNKVHYIKKYLKAQNQIQTAFDKKLCVQFARHYLRNDGIFLMYMISKNSTSIVVTDLIAELWKKFKERHQQANNIDENDHLGNHVDDSTLKMGEKVD